MILSGERPRLIHKPTGRTFVAVWIIDGSVWLRREGGPMDGTTHPWSERVFAAEFEREEHDAD